MEKRGRPRKQEVSESMTIKSDKEFDEVLARAEKLMRKIEEGLYEYFNSNPDKYSRISSVDVKAIYCLRLKKVPIKVSLKRSVVWVKAVTILNKDSE